MERLAPDSRRPLEPVKAQAIVRHALGFLVGGSVFILAIPYGLYAVARAFPGPDLLPDPVRLALAAALGLVGLPFALWSHAALIFTGKGGPTDLFNVEISPRTKHLVVTGPYRYTRNPMVFGVNSCYAALAFYWNSLFALGIWAVWIFLVVFYLKSTEEKRLLHDFGKEYEEYRQQVPMIVPWPGKWRRHGLSRPGNT